jgi:hypothetical protein
MIDREPSHHPSRDVPLAPDRADRGALAHERRRGRRSWSARAQRELAGTLHLVRLERLATQLGESGPIAARVVARRRGASILTIRLEGARVDASGLVDLIWWSFWSRPLDVTHLLHLSWRNDVGWKALLRPAPSTPVDAAGVAVTDDGDHVVRLFAHHAELHPVTAASPI